MIILNPIIWFELYLTIGCSVKLPVKNPLTNKKGIKETKNVLKKEPIQTGLYRDKINRDNEVKLKHTKVYNLSEYKTDNNASIIAKKNEILEY